MSILSIKLVFLLVIFAAGWLGGALPLRRAQRPGGERFMRWGNAFAAGIFLGTGLIHMLAEAAEAWRELGWRYPMAFVLAAAAFALLLLVEHVLFPESAHAVVHAHTGGGEHAGHGDASLPPETFSRRASTYALVIALSLHSVLAGLALGAQHALDNLLVIVVAILAHKSAEGSALGISLAAAHLAPRRAHALLLLFALTTPLGVLLGVGVDHFTSAAPGTLFEAIMLSLTGGTFLYIAAVDIIQDEFLRPGSRIAKWLLATAGLVLSALLAIWV